MGANELAVAGGPEKGVRAVLGSISVLLEGTVRVPLKGSLRVPCKGTIRVSSKGS